MRHSPGKRKGVSRKGAKRPRAQRRKANQHGGHGETEDTEKRGKERAEKIGKEEADPSPRTIRGVRDDSERRGKDAKKKRRGFQHGGHPPSHRRVNCGTESTERADQLQSGRSKPRHRPVRGKQRP
jgi:hypothetical protein